MTHPDNRQLSGPALANALQDARARTWALADDLSDDEWLPPYQNGVNPVAWELAHLAWFAEFWILRGPHTRFEGSTGDDLGFAVAHCPPLFLGPDKHLDSAQLPHADRWTTPLPGRVALKTLLSQQLQACIDAIPDTSAMQTEQADQALYFHRLALFHEDMHAEAFCWMRSSLSYAVPAGLVAPSVSAAMRLHVKTGQDGVDGLEGIAGQGGQVGLGRPALGNGFSFDNESPPQTLQLAAFDIDSQPVCALAFANFLDATGHVAPARWRRDPDNVAAPNQQSAWQIRWFDGWLAVTSDLPALHVNAADADAYCRWTGRRLPTAPEWEHAARTLAGFAWGHSVWEWTSSSFNAYPGFAPGPYLEYSQPWFGNHRELRGGAFATHARMHHPSYRNFFLPQRSDIFSGFRTAATLAL